MNYEKLAQMDPPMSKEQMRAVIIDGAVAAIDGHGIAPWLSSPEQQVRMCLNELCQLRLEPGCAGLFPCPVCMVVPPCQC